MRRINLKIVRKDHPPALAIGHRVPAIRLIASVSLATSDGCSSYDPAVIDTGAPICLFPAAIRSRADHQILGRVRLGGITRRPECQISALLAELRCVLSDGTNSLTPFRIRAYLAEQDNVPALIGMHGFIELGVLHVHIARNRAYLATS